MTLTYLTNVIAGLDPVSSVLGARTSVCGLLRAAKPAVVAGLAGRTEGPVLVVVSHPQDAHTLAEELRRWTQREVLLFPAIEALPYERVRLDRALLAERESVVQRLSGGETPIVVAPVRAVMQPVESPQAAGVGTRTLKVRERVQLADLLQEWVGAGYVDVSLVESPGTFARRGGVLDIFPAGAESPVRIELFGPEIESIRCFDAATQRSTRALTEVAIPPLISLTGTARAGALEDLLAIDVSCLPAEIQTHWLDDLAHLEAGGAFEEVGVFLPYLIRHPLSLVQLLPEKALVVIDSSSETRALAHELWEQSLDLQRSQVQSGFLPEGLRPALVEPGVVCRTFDELPHIDWLSGTSGGEHDWTGLFTPARLFAGRMHSLVEEAKRHPERRMVIATVQVDRVAEVLMEGGVPFAREEALVGLPAGITLLPEHLSEGWNLPAHVLSLLTDAELFGRPRTRAPKRPPRATRDVFFHDFAPGDYVVHMEHGIGRFEGVTRMSIDGAEREFALVQYAGTDRVYVPTDQLERLTRYIGVGEAAPTLNKLGGGEWQRARVRARKAAEDIAQELVDIYSKRMARSGHAFAPDSPWQQELEASFPYVETPDQLRTVEEIKIDMERARPMDRLVCADVGYGKTEVAVRAAFKAVLDGKQVALLAPTTILAQQHYDTFSERYKAFPIRVEVMSRFRSPAEQRDVIRRVAAGEVDVLIGTHRILQKDISFDSLGLLIIDEEQRFGVKHKERLKQMRETIDVLTLTATPIPRTLHMTLVGIREVSVIETPPEGRLPVRTYLEPYSDRLVREAIIREMDRDGQVYIVHNKVSTIEAMAQRVRELAPEARVLVGHGQMDDAHLEKVMLEFARGDADVLVCSTIIENGLDIPNVNTIIVNNAQRLGLTQLYQLRGRVGRSESQAYAYLLYPADVHLSHDALRRMEAVFESQELGAGFSVAMKDLEIRGAGNLLGAEQSGHAAAVGFDLYTRMVAEAVERLRGVPVQEPPQVTIDLPVTTYLPAAYIANEAERLSLYRRLAGVGTDEGLRVLSEEMRDRFGPLPVEVENLVESISVKILAVQALVTSVSLGPDYLVFRTDPGGVYDRIGLHRRYGMDAKISTNVLRIPRSALSADWMKDVRGILEDMGNLRRVLAAKQPATA